METISTDTALRDEGKDASVILGSQTLKRGLDVMEALLDGGLNLNELSEKIGLTKSTTHRIARALIDRGYVAFTPRAGYRLGRKLLQLGFVAGEQSDLISIVKPHLERLAAKTDDTVHFGVLDEGKALYLDKFAGRRRISISSQVGDRRSLTSTGLGKALLLDHPEDFWIACLELDQLRQLEGIGREVWLEQMRRYAQVGRAYDLEENEDQIRCVSAPIRDASGKIVAAISVSSAAQYMNDARMETLTDEVRATAQAISTDLGFSAA